MYEEKFFKHATLNIMSLAQCTQTENVFQKY